MSTASLIASAKAPAHLGRYQLLKRIAVGGMAEIFVARAVGLPGFQKIVVIKRILPQFEKDKMFVEMFHDEARIAATLNHPNIVQLYDVGIADGSYFLSMEYLHGEDVGALMRVLHQRDAHMPLPHAINIGIGVSAGLHYAHEKLGIQGKPLNIVHRDISHQNIFVTYDGGVKILDFGIAKAENRINKTQCKTLKGKIPYMSPEQCRGEPLDRRSDVFATGIVLFELTTGRRLYRAQSEFESMKRIVEGVVPSPSQMRGTYPKGLESIVLKALAKKPEDRFQTTQELQAALESFAREHRLEVSNIALSSFMRRIFGDKLEAWRQAESNLDELVMLIPEKPDEQSDDSLAPYDTAAAALTTPSPRLPPIPTPVPAPLPTPDKRFTGKLAVAGLMTLALLLTGGWLATSKTGEATPSASAISKEIVPESTNGAGDQGDEDEDEYDTFELPPEESEGEPERGGPMADDTALSGVAPVETTASTKRERDKTDAHLSQTQLARREQRRARRRERRRQRDLAKVAASKVKGVQSKSTAKGELRLASSPSCEVIVDGRSYGSTPIVGIKLSGGRHRVHLVNSRFGIDESRTVVIEPDRVTKKRYRFALPDTH